MIPTLVSRVSQYFATPSESKETKFDKKCRAYGLPKDFIVEKKLEKMLFDQHLAEQIAYFGKKNVVQINGDDHLLFGHSQSKTLSEYPKEHLADLEEFYKTAKFRNWTFRLKDLENGPHFEEKNFKDISYHDFFQYVSKYGHEKLIIIEKRTFLTIFELFEKGILKKEADQSYLLHDDFIMTDRGLMRKSHTQNGMEGVYFINKGKAQVDTLYFDLFLHTPNSDLFMDQNTHSSCKITLPNGQSASLGFYPSEEINSLRLEEFNVRHESPDHYIFFKKTFKRAYYVRYEISSKEGIDKFCKALNTFMSETDKKTYQMFHGNCACLLKELVQVAKNDCGAKKISTNYHQSILGSILNRIWLIVVKVFMALIEFFKYFDLKKLSTPIHLPRDLMLLA
jgi:hypothetical protein